LAADARSIVLTLVHDLPSEERRQIVGEFNSGMDLILAELSLKLSFWGCLPWCLCGLAVDDEEEARRAGWRCVTLWKNNQALGRDHVLSRRFLDAELGPEEFMVLFCLPAFMTQLTSTANVNVESVWLMLYIYPLTRRVLVCVAMHVRFAGGLWSQLELFLDGVNHRRELPELRNWIGGLRLLKFVERAAEAEC
jgi:hypothetical protein